VDAIVSGHTHSPVTTSVNGIPIVQARSNGTALGVIDLPLEPGRGAVVALRDVLPDSIAPDAAVDSLVAAALEPVAARMSQPVARFGERLTTGPQGTLGNLIADAQRAAGMSDVAVMNTGGVRAAIDTGVATYGSLFEVQPFGNVLMRVTVTGRDLRAYLERIVGSPVIRAHLSGVAVTYDTTRSSGARVLHVIMSDGAALEDNREYRLVLSDFLAAGGDGLGITERARRVEDLGVVDLDALIAYVRARPSPVTGPRDRRLLLAIP
jgi:2',3'-cyclic-nucleotide 2'-phosphodiesterase (5'-nucleotidase family)